MADPTLPQGAFIAPEPGQPPGTYLEVPPMGGFSLSYHLPFAREDLFNELMVADAPLGSSPDCTFSIMRNGFTEGVVVSPGCVRKVTFASPYFGETISQLSIADRGAPGGASRIVWQQLQSTTRLNLLGRDGIPPEYKVELEEGMGGTLVKMSYNFYKADMKGPLFFLVNCMPSLLQYHLHSQIATVWAGEMVRRGYQPLAKPAFKNLSGNKHEEDLIRNLKALEGPSHPLAKCLGL